MIWWGILIGAVLATAALLGLSVYLDYRWGKRFKMNVEDDF